MRLQTENSRHFCRVIARLRKCPMPAEIVFLAGDGAVVRMFLKEVRSKSGYLVIEVAQGEEKIRKTIRHP